MEFLSSATALGSQYMLNILSSGTCHISHQIQGYLSYSPPISLRFRPSFIIIYMYQTRLVADYTWDLWFKWLAIE